MTNGNSMPTKVSVLLLAALLLLAGCSLAPTYRRPAVDTPAAFKETVPPAETGTWKQAQPAEHFERGQWWKVFDDATLDQLVEQATETNHSLKAAAARLQQSRAIAKAVNADRYPQLDAGFGPTRSRPSPASEGLPADGNTVAGTLWRAQATVSYEADLFGRVANSVEAAAVDAQGAEALYRSLLLALQADVAQGYFAIRALDAEQALLADTVRLREEALQLVRRRFDAGDISELDVARADTELQTARSDAVALARQRTTLEHALAVLVGKAPADFALPAQPLAFTPVAVPAGLPSALLERRPDIAAAERQMAAANARIGVAQAAFFPRLTLTGAAGFESTDLSDLFRWSSRTWLLGPLVGTMLSMPIFDGGRNRANLDRAKAQYEESTADYRQRVLVAFREVEDSLAGIRLLSEQARTQARAVDSAQRAAHISQTRYREGAVSYLDVIDAERSVLQTRRLAAQLEGARADASVALIRALGGGWQG